MINLISKLVFLIIVAFASVSSSFAQIPLGETMGGLPLVDNRGVPFTWKAYTDINGSAYLHDTWMQGSVTTDKGVTIEGVELMYDQVADVLIFRSESGEAKKFIQPITVFSIKNTDNQQQRVFRNGFTPVDAATSPDSYYEILLGGETQLLKRTSKTISEERPYGSATKIKTFKIYTNYYIAKQGKLTKVKKDKKSVLKALSDKETELEAYITTNGLNLKNEEDLASLVAYYNSLK